MNFYIKTLRSNLDNILSSESISPYSFYLSRDYGYRRFDRQADELNDNLLRIDTKIYDDKEDVIYIELNGDDEQIRDIKPAKNRSYFYISKTIYLYPWNCRILFKTIEDARNSVFMCRSSLMNKMWGYYPTEIVQKADRTIMFKTINMPAGANNNNQKEVEADNERNRLKGFLFMYYWGALKSLTPNLARLLQAEISLYGLATALAGMRTPSPEIYSEVDRLKKTLNVNDPNRTTLKTLWNEKVLGGFNTVADAQLFEQMLARYGVQKIVMDSFAAEQGIPLSPRLDVANMAGMNWRQFAAQIDEYTQRILKKAESGNLTTNNGNIELQGGHIGIAHMADRLYEDVLNGVIGGNGWLSVERLSSKKLEVANELTYYAKDFYEKCGHVWEGGAEQHYLNNLRLNIANSSPFDPNQAPSKGLRALAIYVLKGDMVDEMIKYMQVSAVEDYSLVYGLWGANQGYAGIPKTFMQTASLSQQKISECYLATYNSLTGMHTAFELNPDNFSKVLETRIVAKPVISVLPKTNTIEEATKRLRAPAYKLSAVQLVAISDILERNGGEINEKTFKQIAQISGIGKKKLEKIKEVLKPITVRVKEVLLFREEPVIQMGVPLTSAEVMRVIDECIPEEASVRNQIVRDVTWYMRGNRGDAAEKLISGLCLFLRRNKESGGKRLWVRKLYENVDVSQIEKKLKDTYL